MIRVTVQLGKKVGYINCESYVVKEKYLKCENVSDFEWVSMNDVTEAEHESKYPTDVYINNDEIGIFYVEEIEVK